MFLIYVQIVYIKIFFDSKCMMFVFCDDFDI